MFILLGICMMQNTPSMYKYYFQRVSPTYAKNWVLHSPVHQSKVASKSFSNPPATVHIVSGYAGSREHFNGFSDYMCDWSVWRQAEHYGYGHMTYNFTHLRFRFLYADDGEVHKVSLKDLNCWLNLWQLLFCLALGIADHKGPAICFAAIISSCNFYCFVKSLWSRLYRFS